MLMIQAIINVRGKLIISFYLKISQLKKTFKITFIVKYFFFKNE